MVYLREIIKQTRLKFLQYKNIELVAYLSITSPSELETIDFELSPDEEIALKGYKNEIVNSDKVASIISKPSIKGIDATSNIYKFSGLYLASKDKLKKTLLDKYSKSNLKQKYFLSKIEPDIVIQLKKDILEFSSDSTSILIKLILGFDSPTENDLDLAIADILTNDPDVQTQILFEDLEKVLMRIKYVNKDSEELVRDILNNFCNAIQKIIKDRRKEHQVFKIEDEYDVQDILYVILKSTFPNLKDEDPIPKLGGRSTKIDLILKEEKILIEVKMIKDSDKNELHFIDQLKVDFESYHECKWLKKLFCFVYDPYNKTRDISNFQDLDGDRIKGEHKFNVELIVKR